MHKEWSDAAWDAYLQWQTVDRKILKKINLLIKDTERNPFQGLGKPEPLSGDLSGWWSRRIDEKNRLVYRIRDGKLEIAQCGTHYGDK
ncbi:MAG: Txe/YoeB family addiction module toxin [Clostridiaceae bacterium]|nr:Txe/YoeB family addiction module toxin [Clostridiaceae bacterium]